MNEIFTVYVTATHYYDEDGKKPPAIPMKNRGWIATGRMKPPHWLRLKDCGTMILMSLSRKSLCLVAS